MSNENTADALADLGLEGLGTEVSATSPVQADATTEQTDGPVDSSVPDVQNSATGEKKKREHVEIGELEFETVDFIPELKRGGGAGGTRESKYDFDGLAAPVAKEDGSGYSYAVFTAKLQPGVDPEALKRSVQSANTAENRKQKDAKSEKRFITRSILKDGEFVGMRVFRVDGTLDTSAE